MFAAFLYYSCCSVVIETGVGGAVGASIPTTPTLLNQQRTSDDIAKLNKRWALDQMARANQSSQLLSDIGGEVFARSLPAIGDAFQWAEEDRTRYTDVFKPAQDRFIAAAKNYTTEENLFDVREQAKKDTAETFTATRDSARRKLESYGIDAGATRYGALDRADKLAQAKAGVIGANQSVQRNRQLGDERMAQAEQLGANLPANAAMNQQAGMRTGGQLLSTVAGNAGAVSDAYTASNAYSAGTLLANRGAADIAATAAQNDINAANATQQSQGLAGIGTVIGTVAGAYFGGAAGAQMGGQAGGAIGGMIGGGKYDTGLGSGDRNYDTIETSEGGATGGQINAPGGPTSDSGILRVSDGEYILPADVVNKIGAMMLDQFVSKRTGKKPPSTKQAIPVMQGM